VLFQAFTVTGAIPVEIFLRAARPGCLAVIIAIGINKTVTPGALRFGGAFQINRLSPGVTYHYLCARLPPGATTTTWFTILALFIPTPETKKT